MKKVITIIAFAALPALLTGCGEKKSKGEQAAVAAATDTVATATIETDSTLVDGRDGKKYRKVKIGKQVWMAENLNYKAKDSRCYGEGGKVVIPSDDGGESEPETKTLSDKEVQDNCDKYGRLYNWNSAKQACPAGWHLPSDDEWTTLVNYAGGEQKAGKKLKSKAGWDKNGNGTDEHGFSALPGNSGSSDGRFYGGLGRNGYWWSADEYDASNARNQNIGFIDEGVDRSYNDKAHLFSVRCVAN